MFTGLIESVCQVSSLQLWLPGRDGALLQINLGKLARQVKVGDSVAINGVCLTASALAESLVRFDLSQETLSKSTLGKLRQGWAVNVELALKAGERFGGHIVQGHVDGIAKIKAIQKKGNFADISFAAGTELLDEMLPKAAVAVDGISLTVADIGKDFFSVAVIPVTLAKTTLGQAKVGDEVNIETDIIGKMVKKQLRKILPLPTSLTADKLRQLGFA